MLFQRLQDSLPLYFIQGHTCKRSTFGSFGRFVVTQILGIKIRGIQHRLAADQNGTLHQILQLTNVARIRQAGKEIQSVGREIRTRQAVHLCLTVGKVTCQQRNIFTALPQGGQFYGNQVDTVKRSSRKVRSDTILRRSALVADTTRTSTLRGRLSPSTSNVWS